MTTVGTFLRTSTKTLELHGISTARLDTLVLLEDILGQSRAHILAHEDQSLNNTELKRLQRCIRRRSRHEPLSYLRHKKEFFGREFYIDHRVLEPRPESEAIIALLVSVAPQ